MKLMPWANMDKLAGHRGKDRKEGRKDRTRM